MKKPHYYKPLKPGSSEHLRYLAGRAYIKGNMKKFLALEDVAVKKLIEEQSKRRVGGNIPGMAKL